MKEEEKIIKEEKIIEKEKNEIKDVKKNLKKAVDPKKSKEDEDKKKKDKKEQKEKLPAKKGKNETQVDEEGKALTPDPPPFQCFYLMYPEKSSKGENMVLSVDIKDKYAPKKTGIHDVKFHP